MLAKRFEEQVCQHPTAIAVKVGDAQLSYADVNGIANRIGRQILLQWPAEAPAAQAGMDEVQVAALLFEHGADMITGTLGAVKAGIVYVPLDPNYPPDRLAAILEDALVAVIVTNGKNRELAEQLCRNEERAGRELKLINIDAIDPAVSAENLNRPVPDDRIVYLLYTSGSTGRPKGVVQTHRNVNYFVSSYAHSFGIGPGDRMTFFSAFSHDAAVMDLYAGLLHGATLYPLSIKTQIAMEEMAGWLIDEEISVYHSVPTVYRYFIQTLSGDELFPHLRLIILGGEKVLEHDVVLFRQYFGLQTTLVNLYGQSESSYNSSQFFVADKQFEKVTLGKPIPGTRFLVLNEEGEEAGPFETGEIFVHNAHLAVGYWQDPEKTRKAFGRDPELGRVYRTGDLGRVLLDGSIEFVGRKDFQVKIRGFRIELGEIESAILRVSGVREAVVIAKEEENGEMFLVAFIVTQGKVTEAAVRQELSAVLPDYMIPAHFAELEQMPRTPNNKTDRKALQEMDVVKGRKEYAAPATYTEERLAALVAGIVRTERVGVEDNLFEIGLHSLRAVTLIGYLYREFDVKPTLKEIFRMPTVREMARWIAGAEKERFAAITPVPEREYHPVSSAQKRLLLLHQLDQKNMSYNMPKVLEVAGELEYERAVEALRRVMVRHEALRTAFAMVDGEAVQRIYAPEEVPLAVPRRRVEEGKLPEVIREFVHPFDLTRVPLFRAAVAESAEKTWLLLDMHHIISDGTSMGIFLADFAVAYGGGELPPLELQYKDFAAWQNRFFASDRFARQEAYWLEQFAGEVPVLALPTDEPRPAVMDFAGDSLRFAIGGELTEKLRRLARENGATLYMVLLAAYNLLLARYSGQEEIAVGAPVAGRGHADLGQMMGMFVNTLVMRNRPVGGRPFAEFVRDVRENALRAFEHQDYPFEMLVEKLDLRRDLSRNPLFDVLFVLQNTEAAEIGESEVRFRFYEFANPTARFDLALSAFETPDGLRCKLEYRTSLFRRETMERLAGHLVNILADVTDHPGRLLADVRMLSAAEREELLEGWNRTAVPIEELTADALVQRQARLTPDAPALVLGGEVMTYRELDERAEQVGMALRAYGLRPGDVVGLMMRRSFGMLIGLFGVWKAGGAYLPLDRAYPAERLRLMAEDSGAVMVLTDEPAGENELSREAAGDGMFAADRMGRTDRPLPVLSLAGVEARSSERMLPIVQVKATPRWNQLAYIIYTSGSTGRPKGVMVEHQGISNTLQWRKRAYSISGEDCILQLFSFAFDGFLTSCLTPLTAGARVVLLDDESAKDPLAIRKVIVEQQVTHFIAVPSLYSGLLDCLRPEEPVSLRVVTLAGEAVPMGLVQRSRMLLPELELVNEYGPTENSVVSTYLPGLRPGMPITIGGPIANIQVYLLDQYRKPVPVGVTGEICLSGAGLARGYVNRPDITAEKFIIHPFRPGERLYRTGDLGRRLPDGQIEFAGRTDEQVKIRGFRIELGEIEAVLHAHPDIHEAVVLKREDADGSACLAAYYVPAGGRTLDLRADLLRRLPDYMVPARFVRMEQMPLTPNGKIDRKALPVPEGGERPDRVYAAPRDETEGQLAAIWSDVLGVEEVGREDHFFELGGHSLKAAALAAKVYQRFHVELPLREVFRTPTVRELAHFIREAERTTYDAIGPAPRQEVYPLSSAQKRMYALQQLMEGTTYNMPGVFIIEGELDPVRLEAALAAMIRRHESLRTSFVLAEGEPVQRIEDEVGFSLRYTDVWDAIRGNGLPESDGLSGDHSAGGRVRAGGNGVNAGSDASQGPFAEQGIGDSVLKQMIGGFIRPFDLSSAPLLRVRLVRIGERHLLMFDLHHIISDGLSMEIFINEWFGLYAGKPLSDLRIQYKDFAVWQNRFLQSDRLQEEEAYWLSTFAGEVPVLNLPTDFPRPLVMGTAGDRLGFTLDAEAAGRLRRLVAETNTTLFMVLLAAYNLFLAKYTGQDDLVVGTPVAGRPHADLEHVMGMFVNTLALRNRLSSELTFGEFVADVKENSLKAFEHQNYQFEMLVEKLHLQRDLSRNPLFDTMFALQSRRAATGNAVAGDGVTVRPYLFENKTAKFDLSLNMVEGVQGISGSFEYSTDLFRRETVERMARHFVNVLREVLANPAMLLADVELLTEAEKAEQIERWNATDSAYDRSVTVIDQFAAQVRRSPDAVALLCADQTMTYGELDTCAAALAVTLRQSGVRTGDVVGLLTDRSFAMIIGIFAVLKAGGCYLPIDPKYPIGRIEYMLADSGARVLLAQSHLLSEVYFAGVTFSLDRLPESPGTYGDGRMSQDPAAGPDTADYRGRNDGSQIDQFGYTLTYDKDGHEADAGLLSTAGGSDSAQSRRGPAKPEYRDEAAAAAEGGGTSPAGPGDLAYMIYTSGSTGNPKGVMVEHQNLTAYLHAFRREMELTARDTAIQQASYAFDASVEEIFAVLTAGGRLVLPDEDDLMDLDRLTQIIERHQVTVMSCPPLILNEWNQRPPLKPVRIFINSGDVLKAEYITNLVSYAQVYNVYGPTETTIAATFYRCPQAELPALPPIGKPIANYRVYIMDRAGHLLPPGVPGEICIAGDGVARGYLEREDLTADKFTVEPFTAGRRMYRTGDLGRWLPDGNIEFLGRIDHQVKIRGFRVELGEIETRLMQIPGMKEVLVLDRADAAGNKYLCAYFAAAGEMETAALREQLGRTLPQYMIPAHWVRLEKMPLTVNGKIDRAALPAPDAGTAQSGDYVQPVTEAEAVLTAIWADVLRAERVGIRDNFFALGGDSIKAIQILARANQRGIYLTVKDIFRYATVESLLENVDFRKRKLSISQAEVEGEVLLTPIQRWFLEQNFSHPEYYTQSNLFTLRTDADLELLEEALRRIIAHHDALRMSYRGMETDIGWVQYNRGMADAAFILQYADLTAEPYAVQRERVKELCVAMQSGFDLANGLPIRAAVFDLGAQGLRLFITAHHMVIDGVSWRIVLEDLQTLYNSRLTQPLPPKTTSYRDWADKLADYVRIRKVDIEYWQKIDPSALPSLAGTAEGHRTCFRNYRSLPLSLSAEETARLLTQANWAYNTEINDLLLSALVLAMDEALALPEVLLTLEGHGREEILDDADISRTVGWFTSAYPVCFEAKETVEKTIKHVKESLRRVPEKGVNFGLMRYLGMVPHLWSLNPEITFNYLGQFDNLMGAEPSERLLSGAPESSGPSVHPDNENASLLDITGIVAGGKLQITLSYNTVCLAGERMQALRTAYQQKLSELIAHCCELDEQSHTASDFGLEGEFASEEDFELLADLYDMGDDGEEE